MRPLLTLVALLAAASPAQGQIRAPLVIAVDQQPVPTHQVAPEYPDSARKAGLQGRVVARLWIGRDGLVKEATVVHSENALFNENALEAFRQWRFTPARHGGEPVDVWITIPVRFRRTDG